MRAILLGLRRSLPWTNAAAAIRVLLRARPLACSASKQLSTEAGRSAAQARTGPEIPLRSLCPRSSSSKRLPKSFSGTFGNHNAVWLGNALQTRRKVRRLANDCLLLRSARSDQVAYANQPNFMIANSAGAVLDLRGWVSTRSCDRCAFLPRRLLNMGGGPSIAASAGLLESGAGQELNPAASPAAWRCWTPCATPRPALSHSHRGRLADVDID